MAATATSVPAGTANNATHSVTPSAGDRAWAAQIGSFASAANADKLLRQLKAQGYPAYVSPSGAGASLRYRVRVGPLADREAAAQMVAKLKGAGVSATIVPPAA
jgi:DedD protein